MTTAIAIEDVRREVKILRALTGHKNLIQFYDAYEDEDNIYIVMEYVSIVSHAYASAFCHITVSGVKLWACLFRTCHTT